MKLCVLIDREYPNDHSFIEGFYQKALPKQVDSVLFIGWSSLEKQFKRNDNTTYIIFKKSKIVFLRKVKYFLLTLTALYRHRKEIDAVITRNSIMMFFATRFLIFFEKRIQHYHQISNLHAETILDGYSRSKLYLFKARLELIFRRVYLHKANKIIAVSPWMKKYLLEKYSKVKRIIVIPLGVNMEDFLEDVSTKREIDLIYVGTFNPLRRIDKIIEITKLMSEKISFNMHLISSENYNNQHYLRIRKLIDEQKLNKFITLSPRVTRRELIKLLYNSKIGLSVIPSYGHLKQISPTKLMEYMTAGCLVIATKGIPEQDLILQESKAGLLLEFDTKLVANKVIEVLENWNDFSDYGIIARQYMRSNRNYDSLVSTFIREID